MSTYSTLFCADLHVKRRIDEQFALSQIIDLAIANHVETIVAAGDLLDKQTNRSEPVAFFYEQLTRLEKPDIPFWFLQGQHEFDTPPWLSGHRMAHHLHRQVLRLSESIVASGLDFQPAGTLQEALAEVPVRCNLLVAHQVWGDWMGEIASPQGSFAQVPGHITRLVSGDLHQTRLENNKNADGENLFCCSPGAAAAQKIDEPHQHYCVLMTEKGQMRRQALKSRIFLDWPVMNFQEDLDKFMGEIEGELASAQQKAVAGEYPAAMWLPYLRVTYSHRLPDVVRRIEKVVDARALLYWKELPPEDKQPRKMVSLPSRESVVTPLSLLPKRVDKDQKPEVFALAARLLSAPNVKEDLARWWAETLQE